MAKKESNVKILLFHKIDFKYVVRLAKAGLKN